MNDRILPYAEEAATAIINKCLSNPIAQVGVYLRFERADRMALYDVDMDIDVNEYKHIDMNKTVSSQSPQWWISFIDRAARYYENTANFGTATQVGAVYFRDIYGAIEIKNLDE